MGLIRVSDFARAVGCTPQNIYKHVRNYSKELEGHTQGSRRGLLLDDHAQDFIRGVMYPKELSSEASGVLEELNALRGDYLQLGAKYADLAARLAQTEGERDKAILDAGQYQKALAASQDEQEAQRAELQQAKEEADRAAQEAAAEAERAQELQEALDAAQARLEALKGRSWWERLTRKGE